MVSQYQFSSYRTNEHFDDPHARTAKYQPVHKDVLSQRQRALGFSLYTQKSGGLRKSTSTLSKKFAGIGRGSPVQVGNHHIVDRVLAE